MWIQIIKLLFSTLKQRGINQSLIKAGSLWDISYIAYRQFQNDLTSLRITSHEIIHKIQPL